MISDIAMLSVPVYLIWNLQMSVQRKIGVSSVFATGGLSVNNKPDCPSFELMLLVGPASLV